MHRPGDQPTVDTLQSLMSKVGASTVKEHFGLWIGWTTIPFTRIRPNGRRPVASDAVPDGAGGGRFWGGEYF